MKKIEKLNINGESYTLCDAAARVQDGAVGEAPWSSRKLLDTFAPKFSATGAMVACQSLGPLTVTAEESATKLYRTGRNLYDFRGELSLITGMRNNDGSLMDSSKYWGFAIRGLPAGTYTIKPHPINGMKNAYLYGKINNANGEWVRNVNLVVATTLNTHTVTVNHGDVIYIYYGVADSEKEKAANLFQNVYNIQLEPGSTATAYQAYAGGGFAPGEQIPSLPGGNFLWSDAGQVTVQGWEDPVAKIRQLESILGGS